MLRAPEILWIKKTEKKPNGGELFAPSLCTPLEVPAAAFRILWGNILWTSEPC
jgi:hypothetical protein